MRSDIYSNIKGQKYSDYCSIKQRPFTDNDKVIILGCCHIFCEKPLMQWSKIKNICPLCKEKIHCEHDEVTQQFFLMYFGDDLSENLEELYETDIPIIIRILVYFLLAMALFMPLFPLMLILYHWFYI